MERFGNRWRSRILKKIIAGKVWKIGDNIDTDQIYPGKYLPLTDTDEMAKHALEGVQGFDDFSSIVSPCDIVVAGRNFGCGSSREHAAIALKRCGIGAVLAESFGYTFYRNSINIGLPVLKASGISKVVEQGDRLEIDFNNSKIRNLTTLADINFERLPRLEAEILDAGGLLCYIKRSLPI